jgi:hypothetical protein
VESPASAIAPTPPALRLSAGGALPAWQVGQVLEATVLTLQSPERVVLAIAGRRLEAHVETPLARAALEPGIPLRLQVERGGRPVTLKVLDSGTPADPAIETRRMVLRESLPRAMSLTPSLVQIARLAAPEAASAAALTTEVAPPPIAGAARAVLQAVPDLARVTTATGLGEAIARSGVFLESCLAASPPPGPAPPSDLKAALLVLAELLSRATRGDKALGPGERDLRPPPAGQPQAPAVPSRAAPAESTPRGPSALPAPAATSQTPTPAGLGAALGAVEGALARIEVNQLRSVPQPGEPHPGWMVEVPVRSGERLDVLALRIDRDRQDPGSCARGSGWQVSLRLDLDPLGPIHAAVAWRHAGVSATLRAAREETADLLALHACGLVQALTEAGLPTREVRCFWAPVPEVAGGPLPDRLLDAQA